MVMKSPPHPGEVIREFCIKALGLTVTDAAKGLGVSRKALSSFSMGILAYPLKWRCACPSGFGGSAESWLTQQMQYDLAQVEKRASTIKVQEFISPS